MPFKDVAKLEAADKYKKLFQNELKRLNGEPGEFFFCQDFPQGKDKVCILVFGEVQSSVVQALRNKGDKLAWGQCTMEGKTLKLALEKGTIPDAKLRPIFKMAPAYSYEVVNSIEVPDGKSDEDHEKEQQAVRLKRALYTVSQTFKDMGHLMVDASTYRKKLEAAAKHIAAETFDKADKLIRETAAELAAQKPALQEQLENRTAELSAELKQELKDIAGELAPLTEKLGNAEKEVKNLQNTLDSMEKAQKGAKRNAKFTQRAEKIAEFKLDLSAAQAVLAEVRKEVEPKIQRLEDMREHAPDKMKAILANIQNRLKVAEEASISAEESHTRLEKLVGDMAEATEWREEQLKGDGHGTGRHGAQTGLDRQARRAATEEGITPDQPGNVAGVTQHTTTWNKVSFTYEEGEDGIRRIKDRTKVQQNIVVAATNSFQSNTGSIWATPVLEREAVAKALKTANALKTFKEYERDGDWHDFTSLAVVVPEPSSAPGWGYAVKKDGANVDPSVADAVLKDFEEGKKTLDQLFNDLNVKLVTKDGGAEMIHHAIVVFKRNSASEDWKLVTHYPNDDLKKADIGWECAKKWRPGRVKFKDGATTKTLKNSALA